MSRQIDWSKVVEAGKDTRAGGWFWGPLLFGLGFLALAAGFAVAAAIAPVDARWGLLATGAINALVGIGSVVLALWIRRDVGRPDPEDRRTTSRPPGPANRESYWQR